MQTYDIPYYLNYIPEPLLQHLHSTGSPTSVPEFVVAPGLQKEFSNIETDAAWRFIIAIYEQVKHLLDQVLQQRSKDREFIDHTTHALQKLNRETKYLSAQYKTVIGMTDNNNRLVVGPHRTNIQTIKKVNIPTFLKGDQVTLFGPPDTQKMSINAMNAIHRVPPNEPSIIAELVEQSKQVPRWGADNEDSKTPIMRNFLQACENLIGCYKKDLQFTDHRGKHYQLKDSNLSIPIKRIPGLGLPDGHHLYRGNPLPLHLYDFAMHLFHNWSRPQALVFYVPKLENEEEARYLRQMIRISEEAVQKIHPEYKIGSVGLFIVFENPRAIFRIQEMANALHPYFLGGSLGWHDFLASTARLFKNDPNYRIPVKADPNIVINHIKESHQILVNALTPFNAIKIGGMYGVLFEDNNPESYEVSIVGFIKDVITQLKRGLDGFWVAHPAFVRIGIALVQAWRMHEDDPQKRVLTKVIEALVPNQLEQEPLLHFILGDDVSGLDEADPLYERGVLAADIEESQIISNASEQEIRYNIFQALQYITDWLCGNGCVALPATIGNANGKQVFVRIMDDLATTERSRWELWAEVAHNRISREQFEQLLQQEISFIRNGTVTPTKRTQVKWEGEATLWYPIAIHILRCLVFSSQPVEFASELLLPFTFDEIRNAKDPWKKAKQLCPGHFEG